MAGRRNLRIQKSQYGLRPELRSRLWQVAILVGILSSWMGSSGLARSLQDGSVRLQLAEGAAIAPVSPDALPEQVQAQMQAGGNALRQGRYQDAIKAFSQVIRQVPTYAPAFFLRGQTYQAMQQYEQALKDFNRAVKLDPTNLEAIATRDSLKQSYAAEFIDRAVRFWSGQQNEQALQAFSRAIAINPNSIEALISRGQLYREIGNYGAAVQDFTRALELDAKQNSARLARGITYTWMERYPEALADLNQAIEQDPTDVWSWIGRGQLYRVQKQYPQAMADFQRAIAINPEVTMALIEQAEVYRLLNRPQDALKALNRAIELEPGNVWAIVNRSYLYFYDLANHRAGQKDMERGLVLAPADSSLLTLRGTLAMIAGNYHGAMVDFKVALEIDPKNIAALNNRSELWLLQKEYDWALTGVNQSLELDPQDTWAQYLRLLIYHAQGQKAKADAALPDLLTLMQQQYDQRSDDERGTGEGWRSTGNLALLNLLANQSDRASALYRQAIAGAPPDILREAMHDLRTFLTVFPNHAQALAMRQLLQAKLSQR